MNLHDTPEQAAFRERARDFIREHAPWDQVQQARRLRFAGKPFADEADWIALSRRWQQIKHAHGWACLVWPRECGGQGLSPIENVIFQQEEQDFVELNGPFMISQGFIAPTLMSFASEAQQREFLPAIARGDTVWCQMFSEPGAGSDLAGVRTRAERVAGGWTLKGQKVWTSGAHYAAWGMALVRTDADVVKHKGLTMVFMKMDSPGITVRPIEELSGHAHFNEVFLDEVFVPDAQVLGGVNQGWSVALTTLMNERMTIGASTPMGIEEIFELAMQPDADGRRPIDSESVRMKLAEWHTKDCGIRYGVQRMLTAIAAGASPGPEASVGKLVGANATQEIAAFGLDLLGNRALAQADGDDAAYCFHWMFHFGALHRVEGGTDEIMRNVLAERVLGLPAEHRADKGPFRDVPTAPPAA
ncbi:MAG: putative acyl-CoA dehydrogenase [Hydrocarboniphaga sp.]|uniref:acyl-CoA dehydrogenase family protein n=1 Tax=Hydrocarboniphaga sp. TaxID=2033016 RepID=UPI0026304C32|nr:acyl-CoA dehydrogenase family protein [Hydrocarboniphaga sp.]MDB5968417.1 putative acyl-CoA dehydrogenase [Hydrocarboniphaga sp.]